MILVLLAIIYSFFQPLITSKSFKETKTVVNVPSTSVLKETQFPEGKALFEEHCQVCHAKGKTDNLLKGFTERGPWTVRENLYQYIRDPDAFVKKDSYAKALREAFGAAKPSFPHLTDYQIDQIVNYAEE
ncbi:MAG TPA: cytochrome c [Chitinophagaceae bacterium]